MAYTIKTFNNIREKGLNTFVDKNFTIDNDASAPDALVLRSHTLTLEQIPDSVLAVGRAGAGVNNIPVADLTSRGIPVFNTPGANANAVKELVMASILMAARQLGPAWGFTHKKLQESDSTGWVEQAKKQFVGNELPGKTLGVVGLGAIGVKVANAALGLGMKVIGYDPSITIQRALELSSEVKTTQNLDELLRQSHYLTLHIPLNEDTHELIDMQKMQLLPKGAIVLNFARDKIANAAAIKSGLKSQHLRAYVSDFPTPFFNDAPGYIAFPHLGASTIEAEENCAVMIAQQICNYIELGTIENSVNFPRVDLPRNHNDHRIAIVNLNQPNMVGKISTLVGESKINIVDLINKSQHDIAYTLLDIDGTVTPELLQQLQAIDGIISVRKVF